MSGPVNLDMLAQDNVRTAILLSELGGWLHMMGKMDNRFPLAQVLGGASYDELNISNLWSAIHKKFCALLTDNRAQTKLALSTPPELTSAPANMDQFVRQHRNKNVSECILQILFDAHGMASGTEKGTLPNNEGKQTSTSTFAATAFGYEAVNIIELDLDRIRIPAVNAVEKALDQILLSTLSESDWANLYNKLVEILNITLSQSVGDTRRPANEVTLWDQTVTAAVMLKTGLAHNILNSAWRKPLVNTFADKYRWRLLRVYFDGLTFIGQAHHPPDILGRRESLQRAQQAVKRLLEVTYPLAAEAYRDEANIVFVVPDIDDLLMATLTYNGKTITLEARIREEFAAKLHYELEPQIFLGERSRGAINLGQTLQKELQSPQPNPDTLQQWWHGAKDELCVVCRVRPQGYGSGNSAKARSRNICCTCLDRREQRSAAWTRSLSDPTVWIDEAADSNGRIGLIVGRFDLSGWLDGHYFGSLVGRNLPCDTGFATKDYSAIVANLAKELKVANLGTSTPNLQDMKKDTNIPKIPPTEIYKVLVTERDTKGVAPDTPSTNYDRAARFLFQGFFNKPTSFARLRRVWETTRLFWEQAQCSLPDKLGRRKLRLVLRGQLSQNLGPSHVYDIRIGTVETSMVWDGLRLISADNLRYLARQLDLDEVNAPDERIVAEAVKKCLETEKQLTLFEPRSQQGRPQRAATLSQFSVELEEHNYPPAIPLLTDPQMFMALMPADRSMEIIGYLRETYEVQMSKVRNRLPLHLNLLVFNRRLPLYVAIDAARRMLARQTCSNEEWQVDSVIAHSDPLLGKHARRLTLVPTRSWATGQVKSFISYSLGDGSEDFYYPYFFVKQANEDSSVGGFPLANRHHCWQATHPSDPSALCNLVHVSELFQGDKIFYSPSTFDFELLDVARRRFELNYNEKGIRFPSTHHQYPSTRPLLLEEIIDLEAVRKALERLTETQRHSLVSIIETKRIEWNVTVADDPTLGRFAVDTLKQVGDGWWHNLPNDEIRRLLENWATNGRLADVVELYEQMLKM